ncbi:hypothetical protein RhiJN_24805 [Ceratobasidium sp. AG-Ba]|nr:hypothetical protein RhiJN_24805 [Ceratobasidium sp. AG-Ba]
MRKAPTLGNLAATMTKAKTCVTPSKSDGESGLSSGDESKRSGDGDTQVICATNKGKGRKEDSSDQGKDDEEGDDEESDEGNDLGVEEGSVEGGNESSELEDLTCDELLALAQQMRNEQKSKRSKKTHLKHNPLPPKTPSCPRQYSNLAAPAPRGAKLRNPSKLKLLPRVPSNEVDVGLVDQVTVAELENNNSENRGGQAAGVEDIAPKELKNAKNRVSCGALCSIMGWKSCQDADVMQRDEAGEPVYKRVIPPMTRVVSPAWEDASKDAYATHLACMSNTHVEKHLFKNMWDYCYCIVMKKMHDTFESACQAKNIWSLSRHQQTNLIVLRESARKQVSLDDEKYNFLTAPGAQSPELSNGKSGTTKGITYRTCIEPAFLSEVVKLKCEHSAPMVKPGEKRTKGNAPIKYPFWAINNKWVKENPVKYENLNYMINMCKRNAPDHTEVYEEHGNITRT